MAISNTRRQLLTGLAASGAAAAAPAATTMVPLDVAAAPTALPETAADPAAAAEDEAFWGAVRRLYDTTRDVVNLENGYWGLMARPVLQAYAAATARVNHDNAYYARRHFGADAMAVQAQVASLFGVQPEEIAFTRNATEALQRLIEGYDLLRPDDVVIYADVDYPAMQSAMRWLEARRGVRVVRFELPEPATHRNVIDAYETVLEAEPKARLLLLTHLTHRTGLVVPVPEIAAMARERGVDTIVDAAHSFGQIPFSTYDLNADFVGFNLHKWIGAPLGLGLMFVRRNRITDLEPYLGEAAFGPGDIRGKLHTGTMNFAALLALPKAIEVHEAIGVERKAARLRYLRDRWVRAVRDLDAVEVLTPDDHRMHGGITGFRLRGRTGVDENIDLVGRLLEDYGVFTTHRTGLASGACVRVSPALYSRPADVDVFATALRDLVRRPA